MIGLFQTVLWNCIGYKAKERRVSLILSYFPSFLTHNFFVFIDEKHDSKCLWSPKGITEQACKWHDTLFKDYSDQQTKWKHNYWFFSTKIRRHSMWIKLGRRDVVCDEQRRWWAGTVLYMYGYIASITCSFLYSNAWHRLATIGSFSVLSLRFFPMSSFHLSSRIVPAIYVILLTTDLYYVIIFCFKC